jgi:beta-glucosidase
VQRTRDVAASCPWTTNAQLTTMTPDQLANEVLAAMTPTERVDLLILKTNPQTLTENQTPSFPDLCLPSLVLRDGPVGLGAGATGVTDFPSEISLAATFDPALATQYGEALGGEARLQGDQAVQGPGLDVTSYANWGRTFENFGSDPFLTSSLGVAEINGIQSTGTIAVAKHFGPYVTEIARSSVNYEVGNRTLQELYYSPFEAAVAAGVGGLMCSLGETNGSNTCSDSNVVGQPAAWGFTGIMRTDANAENDDANSLASGVDLFKTSGQPALPLALGDPILTTYVNAADLTILSTMFRFHDVTGVIAQDPTLSVTSASSVAISTNVAEQSAVLLTNDGVLPLQRGPSLAVFGAGAGNAPIISGAGSSQVVASNVVTPISALRTTFGAVTYDAAGIAMSTPKHGPIQILAGTPHVRVEQLLLAPHSRGLVDFALHSPGPGEILVNGVPILKLYSASTSTSYINGEAAANVPAKAIVQVRWTGDLKPLEVQTGQVAPVLAAATKLAKRDRVAIVVVGAKDTEGQDPSTLALPGYENQLVRAVAGANPRTVVVVDSGGPVLMPWIHSVAAVLEDWYPGQVDGTALAAVLSGAVDPSGRLPVDIPTSDAAAPMIPLSRWPLDTQTINLDSMGLNVGQRWYDANHVAPLFPFGYGLSYTSFSLGGAVATGTSNGYSVDVQVTNTGPRAGREVVQGYLSFPTGSGEPASQLVTFGSIDLAAGATGVITLQVPTSAFATWSSAGWSTVPGAFSLAIGTSAASVPLSLTLNESAITSTSQLRR